MLGAELKFCVQFADGIIFETIENVERKWAHLAVEFFEQHLFIEWCPSTACQILKCRQYSPVFGFLEDGILSAINGH